MVKKTLANTETDQPVNAFIDAIPNKNRKADSQLLLNLISEISGKPPKIWGVSIVGFGKYKYQRKNGEEFEWFNVGFSPGRARLTLYVMYDLHEVSELLEALGPHEKGKGCLYLKRLSDVNLEVLKQLIEKSDRWVRKS